MKKLKLNIVLFAAFYSFLFSAQSTRFQYQYSYVMDTVKETKITKDYRLDLSPETVNFYDTDLFRRDSINKGRAKMSLATGMSAMISRDRGSKVNTLYQFVDSGYFKMKSADKMIWKLLDETRTEEGYLLQKATTTFGGRHWTAWFCPDIPISEGPYKFQGLPGLIFDVYDDQYYFRFRLYKITNLEILPDTFAFLERAGKSHPPLITLKQYRQLLINNYNNPYADMRQALSRNDGSMLGAYGRQITTTQQLDEVVKLAQADIKRRNNPIEREMAVKYK